MISDDGEYIICDEDGCTEQVKNHKWGKIQAVGWFFSKEGEVYCPEHLPAWLEEWRERRANEGSNT